MVSWTAYLSDGRSINDSDLVDPEVKEDILPFKKLVKQLANTEVQINSVTVNVNGVRYNSPSVGERGNFSSTIKPSKFWISYKDRFLPMQNRAVSFIGLSWLTDNNRTTLWISLSVDKPISWFGIVPGIILSSLIGWKLFGIIPLNIFGAPQAA